MQQQNPAETASSLLPPKVLLKTEQALFLNKPAYNTVLTHNNRFLEFGTLLIRHPVVLLKCYQTSNSTMKLPLII